MIISTYTTGGSMPRLGGPPVRPEPAEEGSLDLFREKVLASALTGRQQFLPWLDRYTHETPQIRRVYREMMKSAVVKAALLSKVINVASQDLQVHPAEDTERDRAAADFARRAVLSCQGGMRKIAETLLLPLLIDGHVVAEKGLELSQRGPTRGKVVYKHLKAKDTQDAPAVQLVTDEFRNVTGVYASGFGQGETFDPRGYVILSHMGLFESPAGTSDFRAAYAAYWKLDTVEKLRIIYLEKYTTPLLKGTYPAGDYESKASVERAMAQAKGGTWFSVPEGVMVEVMQIAMRGESEFQKAIADYKEEIALAIAGAFLQMLTSRGGGGDMRGDSATQKTTSELFVWYLAELLAQDAITQQMLPDLYDYNFAPDIGYGYATLGGINETELRASAELDDILVNRLGLPLSQKERMRFYGKQPAEDEKDTIRPVAKAPSPSGAVRGGGQGDQQGNGDGEGGNGEFPFEFADRRGGQFAPGGGRVPRGQRIEARREAHREAGKHARRAQHYFDQHEPVPAEHPVHDYLKKHLDAAAGTSWDASPTDLEYRLEAATRAKAYLEQLLAEGSLGPRARKIVEAMHRDVSAAHAVLLDAQRRTRPQGNFADRKGGQFAPGGGRVAAKGGEGASVPRGTKSGSATPHLPRKTAKVPRYTSLARRRRALGALKREAELAQAIGGVHLPDSEPADVVYAEDALGKRAETTEQLRDILANREIAARALLDPGASAAQKEAARRVLSVPLHFFEHKALFTREKDHVRMSAAAIRRKEAWVNRYLAQFHTTVTDDRRGAKNSGHRVHLAAETLGGTLRLDQMAKVASLGAVLEHLKETRRFRDQDE